VQEKKTIGYLSAKVSETLMYLVQFSQW